jgi:DNA-binding transcriptional LysR family regulator
MHSRFTLRQLEALMAVAECGGFAAAARSLGVSQPAVSKHIRALERRLGYDLFQITPGSTPRLTAHGQRMVAELPHLLEQLQSVSGEQRARADRQSVVRVGCGDALAELIGDCIPDLYRMLPNCALELRPFDPSVSSILRLQENDIDLAYLTLRAPPSERIGEAIGTVSAGPHISTRLLDGQDWPTDKSLPYISAPDNSFLSRDFEQALNYCGIPLRHVVARVPLQRDRVRLALAGIGAVLSMEPALREQVARGQLRRIGTRTLTLYRCRFINPARYADRTVRKVERFLSEALSAV